MDRPTFDEVPRGYDPRQVDDYLAVLWRYASQVTSRVAAAESALRHERERREAEARIAGEGPAQAGSRIGMMLAIAQREADDIIASARQIAEAALEEAIEEAGANHPIVREAREQADKLLLDAVEESRRLARARHEEIEKEIARSTRQLEELRHQQGEIIGAILRLRGMLGSAEIDRMVAELARAGTNIPPPPEPAEEPPATASSAPPPHAQAHPHPAPPPPYTAPHAAQPTAPPPPPGGAASSAVPPPTASPGPPPTAPPYVPGQASGPHTGPIPTASPHTGPIHTGPTHAGAVHGDPGHTGPINTGPVYGDPLGTGAVHGEPGHTGPVNTGTLHTDPLRADPLGTGPLYTGTAGGGAGETDPLGTGRAPWPASGHGRHSAAGVRRGRHHRQRDVVDAEPYPEDDAAAADTRGSPTMSPAGYRSPQDEEIIDAEIVEE